MIVFSVIPFLLVIACSANDFARTNCGDLKMVKELFSESAFARAIRKTYKSRVATRLECAPLCYADDRCNGMLVCPGICHLFGVFNITNTAAKGSEYNMCDVFVMNRCENNGFPDENGYCSCTGGYGGPFCEITVQDSCFKQWQAFYNSETDESIKEFKLDKREIFGVKIKYITDDKKINTVNTFGQNTWSQSVHELNKSSWNSFDANPRRIFRDTLNWKYQSVMAIDIAGSLTSTSSSTIKATWYSKDFSAGSQCFESDDTGVFRISDSRLLVSKLRGGSTIMSFSSLFIRPDGQAIAAELIGELGQTKMTPYIKQKTPPYWYLLRFPTNGSLLVLRWNVGEGTYKSVSKHAGHSLTWCTDDCWLKIFSVNTFGKTFHGSVTVLARALLSGHRLRVYTGDVASSTKAVYIHGQTISACSDDRMEPIGVTGFDPSGTTQRQIVSSNGQIQTRRYTFDTDSVLEELDEQQNIDWFVDTREWIQVLSMTGDGQNLSGSVADLREKVLMGASVRIVVEFTDGMCQIVDADQMEVSSSGHVAAEIIYHANTEFGENYNITFTAASSHHLWSAIITTEGDFKKYLYTYKRDSGHHESVSSSVDRYTWFVQM
ncbi:uncharacterized protein LOC121389415 [Gigantopelta aegis]|uniref:uncharacterized protein LOC121389415 n=1 Tax=Gigantopelta aegis TaxID=1735272 RepID=UPI001B889A87|nr:uncharacterized protein LOC121389415 [Gigantopelta aegis]